METARKQSQKKKAKEEEILLQDMGQEENNAVPNSHCMGLRSCVAFE